MTVTFRLRQLLDERGVSQSDAARMSGVSFATINRMCTNATHQVSLDVIGRLCAAFEAEPGELFARDISRRPRVRKSPRID
jgi:DNA-binding Xre family transcriptional regulator